MTQGLNYGRAQRMYCTFHLLKNAKKNCGNFDPDFIWNLEKCPTQREYAKKLADFERVSPVAANYLGAISPKNWCAWPHVNIHALHGHRTSNYVESCNSLISEIHAMSSLDALDAMAFYQMSLHEKQCEAAEKRLERGEMLTEYAQELYDVERLFAAQFSAHMSSERYGYALSYKSAHAVRYEVDMFEITCSCPYPGQYLIPCRHIIAGALHKRLLHNEWIRRSCSKFLMNDYYNSLRASSVRLVPLQNIQPDGVTVCPERKKFPGQASKLSALCTWRRGQ